MKFYQLLNLIENKTKYIGYQGRSTKGLKNLVHNGKGWFASHRGVAVQFADIHKHNELVNQDEKDFKIDNSELKGEVYKAELDIKNPLIIPIEKTLWNRDRERKYIKQAKENGNDGLIIMNKDNTPRSFVVFDNKQIKVL